MQLLYSDKHEFIDYQLRLAVGVTSAASLERATVGRGWPNPARCPC